MKTLKPNSSEWQVQQDGWVALPRSVAMLPVVILLLAGQLATAQVPFTTQPEKTETRQGNKEFSKENYTDAEANYKKALDKKNNMPEAIFNLGDAVYEQKRYDEASKQFQLSAQTNPDQQVKAKAYHNLGNTYMESKKWEDAVKAYKNSLKLNPHDVDTKYNLAYANAMLRQQQNQGGQNDKKDQQNKNQKDKQQQDQQQQNQKNQDKQQQNQQQQANKDQQQKQGQQPKLSKEEAEQLLQALSNEEQKTNQKVQQKNAKAVNVKIAKDW